MDNTEILSLAAIVKDGNTIKGTITFTNRAGNTLSYTIISDNISYVCNMKALRFLSNIMLSDYNCPIKREVFEKRMVYVPITKNIVSFTTDVDIVDV